MSQPVRNYRCEPITVAERAHYIIADAAKWSLLFESLHGRRGWIQRQRYATDGRARAWCASVGIPFPGAVTTAKTSEVAP